MIRIPIHKHEKKGRSTAYFVIAHALVDDDRADLARYHWTLHRKGYARRSEHSTSVFMHHDVIGKVDGFDVSHHNADKLDNRRDNLSHVGRSANMLNPNDGPQRSRRSCPYRGVSFNKGAKPIDRPWRGKVCVNGRWHHTRQFATPEEARDALLALRTELGIVVRGPEKVERARLLDPIAT